MPASPDTTIQIADLLTLLWENQLATAAAVDELTLWARSQGATEVYDNVMGALETLDRNASAISDGIMALRGH
ncbi:hypothetical protein HBO38_27095 [Pseudomonas veronii]|uniref:Uncharacterized protein n=1 Tax=Pseudomonas veronii TaxID=76761 RepID=A0A7Y1FBP8_PSEVE|nr:hypothetical protein [Pseudomonas veronii]NMY12049.1 hypothetical protein [Pseudomonas veronii]